MNNFYKEIETALLSSDINQKELIILNALEYIKAKKPLPSYTPIEITKPSYASMCTIVEPKMLPSRKDFSKKESLIALLHSIAHIEYSAIDLALEAIYYFHFQNYEYIFDWLEVALDEVGHFKMIQELLKELNSFYGALPVHSGLFDIAKATRGSLLERMAVIPRYYEASGLDANPKIVRKLLPFKKNPIIPKIIDALEIIYTEEITHVQKGDKWFKYLCKRQNANFLEKFQEIIVKYNLKARANEFNIKARKSAGFSCEELKLLGAKKC